MKRGQSNVESSRATTTDFGNPNKKANQEVESNRSNRERNKSTDGVSLEAPTHILSKRIAAQEFDKDGDYDDDRFQ